jgi:hypothetical protein
MSARQKSDGGGRNAGRGRNNARNRMPRAASVSSKFKGACEALDGHIFDYGTSNSDSFVETKKKIEEYVGIHFDQGSNTRISIETGTLYVIPIPVPPVNAPIPGVVGVRAVPEVVDANGIVTQAAIPEIVAVAAVPSPPMTQIQIIIYTGEIKTYQSEQKKLSDNIKKAYSLVLGQCTESLKSRLLQTTGWTALCDTRSMFSNSSS